MRLFMVPGMQHCSGGAATRTIKSTRLLCPYPQVAKYKGSGDPANATNFQCVAP